MHPLWLLNLQKSGVNKLQSTVAIHAIYIMTTKCLVKYLTLLTNYIAIIVFLLWERFHVWEDTQTALVAVGMVNL